MTKILNLDDLVDKEPSVIVLKGKEHPLCDPNLKTFLRVTKFYEDLGTSEGTVAEIELSIELVLELVPTMERADLEGLNGKQLARLREVVVNGTVEEPVVEQVGGEGAEGKPAAA